VVILPDLKPAKWSDLISDSEFAKLFVYILLILSILTIIVLEPEEFEFFLSG